MSSVLVIGICEFILSFLLGLFSIWLAFKLFLKLTKNLDEMHELKKGNIAAGIFLSSVLVSVGLVLFKVIYPIICTFNTCFVRSEPVLTDLFVWLGYILLYLFITIPVSVVTIWLGISLFCRMTPYINEIEEVKNNNIAVAILLSVITIVLAVFISHGLSSLLTVIIPSPSLPQIQVM